jgi:hypothetical protein
MYHVMGWRDVSRDFPLLGVVGIFSSHVILLWAEGAGTQIPKITAW